MSKVRLGIPIIGSKSWMGGISYTELLVKALSILPDEERPECKLIADKKSWPEIKLYENLFPFFTGCLFRCEDMQEETAQRELAREMTWPVQFVQTEEELFAQIDWYYPAVFTAFPGRKAISWIPDFQHCLWPEFFPQAERQARDEDAAKVVANASLLVFSSEAVREDFQKILPSQQVQTAVLPFYSYPQQQWYEGRPQETAAAYGLPERFFICCNQFWIHKNHKILGDALKILKEQYGLEIPIVCTGSAMDHRTPLYADLLKQYWISLGISEQIYLLGMLPREDQLQLIRRSLAVVQPSLSEGWSTVVEDARAFGKTILLSDLPVHLEQQPRGAVYFSPWKAEDLAALLKETWDKTAAGPDLEAEEEARAELPLLVKNFAQQFMSILQQAESSTVATQIAEPQFSYRFLEKGKDIPSRLNTWGQTWLKRHGALAETAAAVAPADTPVLLWQAGIGMLALALQGVGFTKIMTAGHTKLEEQFLQLLTKGTVYGCSESIADKGMLIVEDMEASWEGAAKTNALLVVFFCQANACEKWKERLNKAGYVFQQERAADGGVILAYSRQPLVSKINTSPAVFLLHQVRRAYEAQQKEKAVMEKLIQKQKAALAAREKDNEERLANLVQMQQWLRESEADRAARLAVIQNQEKAAAIQAEIIEEQKKSLNRLNAHWLLRIGRKISWLRKGLER